MPRIAPLALLTLTLALLSSPALAQQPWSPIKPSPSTQITNGVFTQSPLKLPYPEVSVRTITDHAPYQPSADFEHVFAVPYEELIAYFTTEEARAKGLELIKGEIYPEGKGVLYRVSGSQDEGTGKQFRLTQGTVSRDFLIVVEPQGGQSRVIFKNIVLTTISSGVMPARQGFVGSNFDTVIPFDWN